MRSRLILLAALACIAAMPLGAHADEGRVQVRITVIHASNDGEEVDPRLEELRRQLSAFNFTAYRVLDVHRRRLDFEEEATFSLPGDRTLTITPLQRDREGHLRVRLKLGDLVDTTYSIAEGATLIVGGPRHAGGHLVLAVSQKAVR
jgi:hypothetical protein